MKIINQPVVVKQPRIKADNTATITLGTTLEIDKNNFDTLNDWAYHSDIVQVIIIDPKDWIDFITLEAQKLLDGDNS